MSSSHRKRYSHVPTRTDEPVSKGTVICKQDKRWIEQDWDDWSVNPAGSIILRRGRLFTLNGTSEIFRGYYDDWSSHYDNDIMIRIGNYFITPRNQRRHYVGPWNDWRPHQDGVVIRLGDRFLLNGKTEIYRGPWDEWDIQPYTGKIYIRRGVQFFANDKEIYTGPFDGWGVSRRGLIVRCYDNFFADGKQLIYSGQWHGWRAHLRGVVIRLRNEWRVYS